MRDLPETPIMNALTLCGSIIDRRNTIPILGNVLIAVRDGRLYMTATDLDCEIAVDVEPANVADFTTTAGHAPLNKIVAVNGAADFVPGAGRMVVLTGGPIYTLATLPADDFPTLKKADYPHSFRVPAADMLADLLAVRAGMSTEETRYYLNGVYMHLSPSESDAQHLRFTTTDWHRLFVVRRPMPEGLGDMPGVIIPRRAITALILALEQGGHDDVQIEVMAAFIRFTLAGVTITTKAIDGTFPDYGRVIPSASTLRLTCSAADLIEAADCAAAIASDRSRALKIKFDAAGCHTVTASSPENGEMRMVLRGEVEGALFESIGLSARYLRDCCDPFGDATIVLGMDGAATPVLITAADDPSRRLTVVQMPMRV